MNCEVCSQCNGKKYVIPDYQYNTRYIKVNIGGFSFFKRACPKCDGNGVINWIDNIIESKEEKDRKDGVSCWKFEEHNHWWNLGNRGNTEKTWKHWSDKSKR